MSIMTETSLGEAVKSKISLNADMVLYIVIICVRDHKVSVSTLKQVSSSSRVLKDTCGAEFARKRGKDEETKH